MSNQKNEWNFQDSVTKKEFKVLYDALKCAKIPPSTKHNAVHSLEDVVLILPYMCKNGATANRAVAELLKGRQSHKYVIEPMRWLDSESIPR